MDTLKQFILLCQQAKMFTRVSGTQHGLAILKYLYSVKEANVSAIYIALRTEQSVASSKLKAMQRLGIVTCRQERKKVFYKLNTEVLEQFNESVEPLLKQIIPKPIPKRKKKKNESVKTS
jgi:DNA-binding transcriptional ArsR family regulator